MWKENLLFRGLILYFLSRSCKAHSYTDEFPNFECTLKNKYCEISDINDNTTLQSIVTSLQSYQFSYYNQYVRKLERNEKSQYEIFAFKDSTFERFSSDFLNEFSHAKSISAVNVGLLSISRDDFKHSQKLQKLNLSHNKITKLESVLFLYLQSLSLLNISNNLIDSISSNAFDESALLVVDLSNNKLKSINENIINSVCGSDDSVFIANFNEIEKIDPSETATKYLKTFKLIDLSHNQLKNFTYNCINITELLLNDNNLEEYETFGCKIHKLNMSQNNLSLIKNPTNVSELSISNNANLKNLSINLSHLKKLEIRNIPTGLISYKILRNATNLVTLDAANTFLGTPEIHSFSKMRQLENLILKNTGLSHIEYGMFGHQVLLENFDISNNNLGQVDTEIISSLRNLITFDISGNNLTELNTNSIKSFFPKLMEIGIENNNWNCSYLSKLIRNFNTYNVFIKQSTEVITDSANYMGIGCKTLSQVVIKPIDPAIIKDEMSKKLNEIIEQINSDKMKSDKHKDENEVIKAELFHIHREIIEMKTKLLQMQISSNLTPLNDSKGTDLTVIRGMMEQLNNFTLEKQKLATDQLKIKIDQVFIELTKEHDKFLQRDQVTRILSDQQLATNEKLKLPSDNGSNITNVVLAVLITVLVIIGVIFGYSKLKTLIYKKDCALGVRARSTNTVNTFVELPIDNRSI